MRVPVRAQVSLALSVTALRPATARDRYVGSMIFAAARPGWAVFVLTAFTVGAVHVAPLT